MLSITFGAIGFLLAAYAVIGNDSAQTLGTFISSNNKKVKWYWMWLFASVILGGTLMYGWIQGDIAFGRLNKIFESTLRHGAQGVAAMEFTHNVEAIAHEISGGKEYKEWAKERYMERPISLQAEDVFVFAKYHHRFESP